MAIAALVSKPWRAAVRIASAAEARARSCRRPRAGRGRLGSGGRVAPCDTEGVPSMAPREAEPHGRQERRSEAPAAAPAGESEDAGCCDGRVVDGFGAVMAQMAASGAKASARRTPFHSAWPPSMPIGEYVSRLRRHYDCSYECVVIAFVYLNRVLKLHPQLVVEPLTCHRLVAACLTLAVKWQDDDTMSNADYANVCGLTLQELNGLERAMLRSLGYSLVVSVEEFGSHRCVL